MHALERNDLLRLRALAIGAQSVGALALGVLAISALAVGAVAIGCLAIGRARIKHFEIGELVVKKLRTPDSLETTRDRVNRPVPGRGSSRLSR